jgi:3-oxoadipate enol-lactonase
MPFIQINENTRLFYSETGGGKHTVVLAHGLLMNHRMFNELVSALYGRYRVIAYDHRGQGQSDNPPQGEDLDTLTQDAAALIQQLSPNQPVHFIGMSMGGMVGVRLAAREPQLIRSLSLIDTSAAPEPFFARMKFRLMCWAAQYVGVKPFVPIVIRLIFGRSTRRDENKHALVQQWREQISALSKSITRQVRGVMERADIRHELKHIQCPTLVICGSEDTLTSPRCAKEIVSAVPGAELLIVQNAGHTSNVEQPAVVNLAVFRHLERVDS